MTITFCGRRVKKKKTDVRFFIDFFEGIYYLLQSSYGVKQFQFILSPRRQNMTR